MSEDQRADVTLESWLTVAEASARVGVSERAMQRRAKAGKLRAKLVDIPTGQQWLIAADALPEATTVDDDSPNSGDTLGDDSPDDADTLPQNNADSPDDADTLPQNNADSGDDSLNPSAESLSVGPAAATLTPTQASPLSSLGSDSGDAMAAALLAEKDARIDDLRATVEAQRAQIEEANRNAAELRAALREAQRIYAKALPAPGDQEASGAATPIPDPPAVADLRLDQPQNQPQKKSWFARTFLRAD